MRLNIEDFRLCDAKTVSELVICTFRASFCPKYSPHGRLVFEQMFAPTEIVARISSAPENRCRLAWYNDEIVGMIETRPIQNGLRIVSLFVEAAHKGMGFGSSLVRDIDRRMPSGKMTVLAAPGADQAYQKMGFSPFDEWKQHQGMLMLPMVKTRS